MRFRVTKVRKGRWVDASLSDCMRSGFFEPGFVNLVGVEPVPVDALPSADRAQFGHDAALGVLSVALKTADRLFGRLSVGDELDLDVEVGAIRNKVHRRCGTFRTYLSTGYYGNRTPAGRQTA